MCIRDRENPGNEDTEKGYIYYLREKELRIFKAGELNSERYYLRDVYKRQGNKSQIVETIQLAGLFLFP